MPNDINELDVNDIGLKEIFKNRFHDATQNEPVPGETYTATEYIPYDAKSAQRPSRKPMNDSDEAQWEPARPAPNVFDNLKRCAKSVAIFGGLNVLVFYWQNSGLMAQSIALPCMLVCAVLAGFGIGNAFGGK